MFRREWRQQLLVMALLTVTVTGALLMIAAAYNSPSSPEARFGTASQLFRYQSQVPDSSDLAERVAEARRVFGTIDVIGYRRAPMPGLTRTVDIRAQDPHGPYGGPMLRLVSGRYPTAAGEVAVTDQIGVLLDVRVGGRLALDGHTWTVVGLVENPGNLGEEFVLVPPAFADPPTSMTILAPASTQNDERFSGNGQLPEQDERTIAAATVFALVALAMLLVGLVAVAAFIAVAQRRRRQFGLLAATGATERHVRLVLLAAGAVAGAAAAVLGTLLAAPLWIVMIPWLEPAVAHRIGRLDVPWWLVGTCLLLAVVTAVGAAWWPARAAARIPVTQALSMRPPQPKPAHGLAILAVLFLAAGAVCLRLAHKENVLLNIVGTIAVVVGLLLLGPGAVRVAAAVGVRLPVAPRLALRDLARHQARSGAALAAISLALAVPAFVVIESAASAPAGPGNLSDRQLLIRVGPGNGELVPDLTPTQAAAADAAVHEFAASLGTPTVIGLDVAMDPRARPEPGFDGGPGGRMPVLTGVVVRDEQNRITGIHSEGDGSLLYLGSPELVRYLGLDAGVFGSNTEVLTALPPTPAVFLSDVEDIIDGAEPTHVRTVSMPAPAYRSLPHSLLNPATAQRRGWQTVRAGWLIEADQPLTTAQIAAARTMAVQNDLSVETRDSQVYLLQLRAGATGAGGVLALGVLAMTVGLIRGEGARDLRTLTATGATRRIRRTLSATTAGGLAVLGAILGTAVAYLSLAAIHDTDSGKLAHVPVVDLTVILVGVPLLAAASAWLLAGREPRTLGRIRTD